MKRFLALASALVLFVTLPVAAQTIGPANLIHLSGTTIVPNVSTWTFGGSFSGLASIASGGTNQSSQTTNGVNFFDGTHITSGTSLTFNGSLLSLTGNLIASASSTIGNGTQAGGLTISGGATTTGVTFLSGNIGAKGEIFFDTSASSPTLTSHEYIYGNESSAQLHLGSADYIFLEGANGGNGFGAIKETVNGKTGVYIGYNQQVMIGTSSNSVDINTNDTAELYVSATTTSSATTPIFEVASSSGAIILYANGAGNVGIATSTPVANFQAANGTTNSTTTMEIGKSGQTINGSCIKLYRTDGTAIYAYVLGGATTFTLSTTACATVTGF